MNDEPNDQPSDRSRPDRPVKVRLTVCPNCGRKGAAVFPLVNPDKDTTVRLVCANCCPKPPDKRLA
jgi:hypothetical protein